MGRAVVRHEYDTQSVTREPTYPWLSRVILDTPDFQSGLLPELALDSVFKCLTGFNETGEGGIKSSRPFALKIET